MLLLKLLHMFQCKEGRYCVLYSFKALKRHEMKIMWDREVLDILADGYDLHYGARSIKHEVNKHFVI